MTHLAYTGEYPGDWEHIRWQVYARAGWRCEHCGMAFEPGTTRAISATRVTGEPMILTVHHLNGDKSDNRHENLISACQRCHLHIQAVWKPGGVLPAHWEQPPMWISKRGLPYVPNGQLALFEDGEI